MAPLDNTTNNSGWFPGEAEPNEGWRMDAVTLALLAIIGDARSEDLTRAMTATRLAMLPRLVPAMQLLSAVRPERLPRTKAILSDIYGPTPDEVSRHETIGYFVNVLHGMDDMDYHRFRVLEVTHNTQKDEDVGFADFKIASVPPSRLVRGMLVFSSVLTLGLFIAVMAWQDGPAALAIALMGLASSLMGRASSWRPMCTYRESQTFRDQGATQATKVIGNDRSNLVVIRSNEAVSEELYLGCIDYCSYRTWGLRYGVLMAAGSIFLMFSILMLGNCSWRAQISIAASYIVLNSLYWTVSMLPRRLFWDTALCQARLMTSFPMSPDHHDLKNKVANLFVSRYVVNEVTPPDALNAHEHTTPNPSSPDERKSSTRTLWFTIREVGSTGWVEEGYYIPPTPLWKQWLAEAQQAVDDGDRAWPAVARELELMPLD